MEVFAVARSSSLSSLPVVVLAYKATRSPRKNNPSPPRKKKPPTIAEVQRAIGVADEPFLRSPGGSDSSSSSSPPFLGFFMQESAAERKLREAAEWMVERTEAQAQSGRVFLLLILFYCSKGDFFIKTKLSDVFNSYIQFWFMLS